MNIYIWERIDHLTTAYHTEGGLIIITNRDPQTVWNEEANPAEYYGPNPNLQLPTPDITAPINTSTERVILFPDSGCC